jgi:hypothetical protein
MFCGICTYERTHPLSQLLPEIVYYMPSLVEGQLLICAKSQSGIVYDGCWHIVKWRHGVSRYILTVRHTI